MIEACRETHFNNTNLGDNVSRESLPRWPCQPAIVVDGARYGTLCQLTGN